MHSLSRRLLVSVSLPLALFFGVMMVVIDTGFRELSDRSLQEALDSLMVTLVAAAELQPNGGYAPPLSQMDSRLATPRSGMYAQIRSQDHQWRSPSTAGFAVNFGPLLKEGERSFSYGEVGHDRIAIESRGIKFVDDPNDKHSLTFSVAVSLSDYEEQLWNFRRQLLYWFAGMMILLLVTLAALLRWVLSPVRRLEREIHEVEEGRSEVLGAGYPRELSGVATNLNALLVGERKRVARYRDTLGNLAHSLKTPLAVMRSTLASFGIEMAAGAGGAQTMAATGTSNASATTSNPGSPQPPTAALSAEIDRMNDIIQHQLKRAAASGGALLGQAPVDVAQVAGELRTALLKVYARKDLAIELQVAPGSQFVGDRGDLIELLGNLIDNACKWCRSHVRVTVALDERAGPRQRLCILVEDDGPGISEEDRVRIGQRGVRTDESVPGHGIGLAMVSDSVDMYGGSFTIEKSIPLGGACFYLRLPGR